MAKRVNETRTDIWTHKDDYGMGGRTLDGEARQPGHTGVRWLSRDQERVRKPGEGQDVRRGCKEEPKPVVDTMQGGTQPESAVQLGKTLLS